MECKFEEISFEKRKLFFYLKEKLSEVQSLSVADDEKMGLDQVFVRHPHTSILRIC